VSSLAQPVRGRGVGSGRPALVAGVLLLVASLALLAPPPVTPDLPSLSFPSSLPLVDVLVQGGGAAAAVAAVGGTSLAVLPIVDGLVAGSRRPGQFSSPTIPASGP
jgi:hypothetical protein